jgi:hypothetical protein
MSLEREYTEEWVGYWSYVLQRASDNAFRAVREIQRRNYEPKDFISDVIGFWTDVGVATVTAWRGQERRPATLIFRVDIGDDFHPPETIPVFAPSLPFKEPSVFLEIVGEKPEHGRLIKAENVRARLRDKRELEIKLVNLSHFEEKSIQDPKKLLAPAHYRAIVHIDEVPLAELLIIVERTARRPWKRAEHDKHRNRQSDRKKV